MTKSTVDAVTRKEVHPGSSMRNSKQKDDDCISEDSFGSDFDNASCATDEEKLDGAETKLSSPLDSPPPVYSEEERPQSTSLSANMDMKSPSIVLQYTPPRALTGTTELEPAFNVTPNLLGPSMCVVCKVSPAYSKDGVSYQTCRALKCSSTMGNVPIALNLPENQIFPPQARMTPFPSNIEQGSPNQSRSSAGQMRMCDVCHLRPRAQKAGKSYSTCGLACAAALKDTGPNQGGNAPTVGPLITESYQILPLSCHTQQPYKQHNSHGRAQLFQGITSTQTATICVICLVKPCRDGRFVTCGMKCTEKLWTWGNSNSKMCDYCHRRPKFPGHNQCGKTCGDNASRACLLCRSRPRFGRYHLCGRTCKMIASKWTPLILEVRPGHFTYKKVEQMFKRAWKGSGIPSIKKVYKVIENKSFLVPFDRYKRRVGNEVHRYHGTSRKCTLGSQGNTRLCPSTACALCSILRTSFKISQSGPFGDGVYTSSAANTAYKYSNGGKGAIVVTKVVLGTVYNAKARREVKSCPPGHNSVVFNNQKGKLDETTVIYTEDAIRPVFLIIF